MNRAQLARLERLEHAAEMARQRSGLTIIRVIIDTDGTVLGRYRRGDGGKLVRIDL